MRKLYKLKNIILLLTLIIFCSKFSLAKEKNETSLITKLCLIGFHSEMELAGKNPPPGMATFTCNCFTKKISHSLSVESAQKKCKEEASKNFEI